MSRKISKLYSALEVFAVFALQKKHWEKLKKEIDKEFETYEEVRIYMDESSNVNFEGHIMRDDPK